ncbi:MAG: amidohydrolase family protein [Chloroflexi bacterium]|nr:amidohydrolase family protein [Chloroflexota bacterium]
MAIRARDIGAIDMMCYLFTPKRAKEFSEAQSDEFRIMARTVLRYYAAPKDEHGRVKEAPVASKSGIQADGSADKKGEGGGLTPEKFVEVMTSQGIDKTLVCTNKMYSYRNRIPVGGMYYQEEEVYEAVKNHPGKLYGLAGYDPLKIHESIAKVTKAVKEYGFKGVYIHTYGYGLRADDRKYYPLYETCRSLGVPVSMQVGHSLEVMPSEAGRPIVLDEIAVDFPGLILIGSHTGWPWCEELIAMAYKHENVYMDVSAHGPQYWDQSLATNVNGRLRTKTLWGSNGVTARAATFFDEMDKLNFREDTLRLLLRENAMRVYNI